VLMGTIAGMIAACASFQRTTCAATYAEARAVGIDATHAHQRLALTELVILALGIGCGCLLALLGVMMGEI